MNVVEIGLDATGFNEQKKKSLQDFIALFEQLEKYDGLKINPVLGEGLLAFNSAIEKTSLLLESLNVKIATIGKGSGAVEATTELGAAVSQYAVETNKSVNLNAKLAVSTSDVAKENIALKYQLSETTKQMLANERSNNLNVRALELAKIKTVEYSIEQARVVEKLRAIAIEQDRDAKSTNADTRAKEMNTIRSREYRIEQERVVERLRALSVEQDRGLKGKREDSRATLALATDYGKLQIALQEQALAYQNLYIQKGKSAPETKFALAEYQATAAVTKDISKNLGETTNAAGRLGTALTHSLGYLRNLAYILPGIGLAGIFDKIFQAIGSATEAMDLFTSAEEKETRTSLAAGKALQDLTKISEEYLSTVKSNLTQLSELGANETVRSLQHQLTESQNLNKSKHDQLDIEKKLLFYTTLDINNKDSQASAFQALTDANSSLIGAEIKLKEARTDVALADAGEIKNDKELLKSKLESAQITFDIAKDTYTKIKNLNEDNSKAIEDYNNKIIEIQQYEDEQKRKLTLSNAQTSSKIIKDNNEKILSDERNFEEKRITAIKSNYQAEISAIKAGERYKLEQPDARNSDGSLTTESKEAINDAKEAAKKAQINKDQAILAVQIEFYQRRLSAQTDYHISELNQQAIGNQKIFKNDKNSLDERLKAYTDNVLQMQAIDEARYAKDIQRGAKELGGKTSLTGDEKNKLFKENAASQVNLQADAEKQIYDIVYSSLQRELKAILDENASEDKSNKLKYAAELERYTDLYEQKKITYRKYRQAIDNINKEYTVRGLDKDIDDDIKDLDRLANQMDKLRTRKYKADSNVESATVELQFAKDTGGDKDAYQYKLDKAVGEQQAINDALTRIQVEYDKVNERLADDKLKRAKARLDLEKKYHDAFAANVQKIIDALYKFIKEVVDSSFQHRIERIQQAKAVFDESNESEQDAVSKSSLSAKDKAALEIQLQAEKSARDKQYEQETRALKIQQAKVDRDLAIAHIVWSTEAAIAKTYEQFGPVFGLPLSIQQAILGAIEIATVLAHPLPSFAQGTKSFEGGLARFAEAGPEVIKEPYKSPYIVLTETVSYLPKDTQIIPIKDYEAPLKDDGGWEQTRWLASQMKKNNKDVKNYFRPVINIDLGFENYKRNILGNG